MYTVYVSLQALQLSSTLLTEVVRIRQACVGLRTPFSQIMVALTLLPLLNICTLPGCLYIWWFLWILLGNKLAKIFMSRHRHSAKVVLFKHNSYTVRWTTVLRSGECWPSEVLNLVSITFCERSTWILIFCNAWLLGIVMSVQVSRFTAQFCKNTERLNLKVIQY